MQQPCRLRAALLHLRLSQNPLQFQSCACQLRCITWLISAASALRSRGIVGEIAVLFCRQRCRHSRDFCVLSSVSNLHRPRPRRRPDPRIVACCSQSHFAPAPPTSLASCRKAKSEPAFLDKSCKNPRTPCESDTLDIHAPTITNHVDFLDAILENIQTDFLLEASPHFAAEANAPRPPFSASLLPQTIANLCPAEKARVYLGRSSSPVADLDEALLLALSSR